MFNCLLDLQCNVNPIRYLVNQTRINRTIFSDIDFYVVIKLGKSGTRGREGKSINGFLI